LIADDADVTVIAAHAARMGIDTLIPRDPSAYPHSVYMIGLAKWGVFDSAFDTYPIDVGPPSTQPDAIDPDPEEAAAELARIVQLITEHKDDDSSGTPDSATPTP
jgi:hypothetical protein